jgi:N utilization substance protein A
VSSIDPAVDPVGSCVGLRGIRVKAVLKELSNEKLDIIRWSDSIEVLLVNGLAPLVIRKIVLDSAARQATITTAPKRSAEHSIDIGRARLLSRAIGWELQFIET